MSPDQIAQAYTALQTAVGAAAPTAVSQVNTAAAAKAPALAPSAYDAGRYVTPVAGAVADKLVVAAKQALLKKVLTDAQTTAQDNYTDANNNYQTRQRKYYRDQAIAAANRQRAQDAAVAAQNAANTAIANGSGGSVIVNKAAPVIPKAQPLTVGPVLQNAAPLQNAGGLSVGYNPFGSGILRVQ